MNTFILCRMAAKTARAIHNPAKQTLGFTVRFAVRKTEDYLLTSEGVRYEKEKIPESNQSFNSDS